MTRARFLTLSAAVALGVSVGAIGFPAAFLASKGVEPTPALLVWMREVGALILAASVTTFLARNAPDSLALRGVLLGNAVLHLALLPIELIAFAEGVITKVGGVAPNSLLHAALGVGFLLHARRVRPPAEPPREPGTLRDGAA